MRQQCDISKVANPVTFLKWGDTSNPSIAREALACYPTLPTPEAAAGKGPIADGSPPSCWNSTGRYLGSHAVSLPMSAGEMNQCIAVSCST